MPTYKALMSNNTIHENSNYQQLLAHVIRLFGMFDLQLIRVTDPTGKQIDRANIDESLKAMQADYQIQIARIERMLKS